jgi:hypothetical protein
MNPNLVGAACERLSFDQGEIFGTPEQAKMCLGRLPVSRVNDDTIHALSVAFQFGVATPGRWLGFSVDHRQIALMDATRLEEVSERLDGTEGLGEKEDSGRVLVETVDISEEL